MNPFNLIQEAGWKDAKLVKMVSLLVFSGPPFEFFSLKIKPLSKVQKITTT